jgi:hypothetical protein
MTVQQQHAAHAKHAQHPTVAAVLLCFLFIGISGLGAVCRGFSQAFGSISLLFEDACYITVQLRPATDTTTAAAPAVAVATAARARIQSGTVEDFRTYLAQLLLHGI